MVNIFTDLHHGDLYYSLHLLFEKRLRMNLFRPIGLDWFKKGFWKIAEPYGNAPDTIAQHLDVPVAGGGYGKVKLINDIYHIPAKILDEWYKQRAITFDKFLEMDIDIIIATYMGHEIPYYNLVKLYKPDALYLYQIGNPNVQPNPKFGKNVLLAKNTHMPPNINYIKYHPEHHKNFSYIPPTKHKVIKNFVNRLDLTRDYSLCLDYERLLPDFTFKIHGIGGRDGLVPSELLVQAMQESGFMWNVKHMGDGFAARQALACGRPCIVKMQYEQYALTRDLFKDGVNCIDLDLGFRRGLNLIREWSEPSLHAEICKTTAEKFKKDVNFDREAREIEKFINNLSRGVN